MYKAATAWIAPGPEIMELPQRLDSSTATTFAEDAVLCITSGASEMILDACHLTQITAAGMRSLLSIAKVLHDHEGKLSICNMKPQVKEFFDATGFDFVIANETQSTAVPHLRLA